MKKTVLLKNNTLHPPSARFQFKRTLFPLTIFARSGPFGANGLSSTTTSPVDSQEPALFVKVSLYFPVSERAASKTLISVLFPCVKIEILTRVLYPKIT